MSFLDRIAECNAHDLGRFAPFVIDGERFGWVKRPFARRLAAFPETFIVTGDGVALAPKLRSFYERSSAVDVVLRRLAADGAVPAWRGEMYPVARGFGAEPLLQMERAAIPLFGVRSYGVHVNGFVREGGRLGMWIARRAKDKPTYPGMLDNFVAGGQPIGLGLKENVVKECGEEAGVPPELAARAVAVGAIGYCHETADGLKPDVQFVYDLELPPGFTPRPCDGEIDDFYLWPVERVMTVTRDSAEFKFNCNLVNIDFFVRHGLLDPEDPDYLAIVAGLWR
ncbi:MAG: DUF4743 domain-containing protein [Alphaproteobacteria bacterium]